MSELLHSVAICRRITVKQTAKVDSEKAKSSLHPVNKAEGGLPSAIQEFQHCLLPCFHSSHLKKFGTNTRRQTGFI